MYQSLERKHCIKNKKQGKTVKRWQFIWVRRFIKNTYWKKYVFKVGWWWIWRKYYDCIEKWDQGGIWEDEKGDDVKREKSWYYLTMFDSWESWGIVAY